MLKKKERKKGNLNVLLINRVIQSRFYMTFNEQHIKQSQSFSSKILRS